jgi:hypothetical protein
VLLDSRWTRRQFDRKLSPFPRGAPHLEAAAQVFNSFSHPDQPEMRSLYRQGLLRVKAAAIVDHPHAQTASFEMNADPHLLRLSVVYGVICGLTRHHQEDVFNLPIERHRLPGNSKSHRHMRGVAHLLGHLIEEQAEVGRCGSVLPKVPDRSARLISGGPGLIPGAVK